MEKSPRKSKPPVKAPSWTRGGYLTNRIASMKPFKALLINGKWALLQCDIWYQVKNLPRIIGAPRMGSSGCYVKRRVLLHLKQPLKQLVLKCIQHTIINIFIYYLKHIRNQNSHTQYGKATHSMSLQVPSDSLICRACRDDVTRVLANPCYVPRWKRSKSSSKSGS